MLLRTSLISIHLTTGILKSLKVTNVFSFQPVPVKLKLAYLCYKHVVWPPGALISISYNLGYVIKCFTDDKYVQESLQEYFFNYDFYLQRPWEANMLVIRTKIYRIFFSTTT